MQRPITEALRLNSPRHAYNYSLAGNFAEKEVNLLAKSFELFFDVVGDRLGNVLVTREMCFQLEARGGNYLKSPALICLNTNQLSQWTVLHELGHALDASRGWQLSRRMQLATGSGFPLKFVHKLRPQWRMFWYHVGSPPPPCGVNAKFNAIEDFAETVAAYILPEKAKEKAASKGYHYENYGYSHFHQTPRGQFFTGLLNEEELENAL